MVGVIVLCAVGTARSAAQLIAMGMYSANDSNGSLARAALVDPSNYQIRLRLARADGLSRQSRCSHARAAHGLFPNAAAASALSRGCD